LIEKGASAADLLPSFAPDDGSLQVQAHPRSQEEKLVAIQSLVPNAFLFFGCAFLGI
jgi:hypothetical protein